MTGLGIYGTAIAICIVMVAATVVWFVNVDRDRRALDDAREYITGTEDARDAQDAIPDDDAGLVEWLRSFAE